ncbi:hypothetical protein Pan44_27680 [Caulifigura coniformis]|uniref:Uncharacterized protein n=1 Tax=Caulifigura coniformis TaxID=2527983 RepID=A0A517SF32_9PLAN|nr:hypothetical protein Pan44_27680 [Caulifigura coniformis]
MEFTRIVVLSILAAVGYGICHDQVTVRVCLEYFTIGHAPVFNTTSPTLLAIGWGVIASWWMGAFLGIPLAAASRIGSRPKLTASDLLKPIGILLAVMAGSAFLAGVAGSAAAASGRICLTGPMKTRVPLDRHQAFLTDLCAHNAAYAVGFVGGFVLCGYAVHVRKRRELTASEHWAQHVP